METQPSEQNDPAVVKYTGPKHTPGRWHVNVHNRGDYYGDITSDLGVRDGVGQIRTIAVILKYAPQSEREANARLITAAPDMLAALREVVSSIRALGMDGWSDGPYLMEVCGAAIDKAVGDREGDAAGSASA